MLGLSGLEVKMVYIEDEQYVKAAQRIHTAGFETLEVDDNALVSRTDGNPEKGAYIAAWIWVYDEDVLEVDR